MVVVSKDEQLNAAGLQLSMMQFLFVGLCPTDFLESAPEFLE